MKFTTLTRICVLILLFASAVVFAPPQEEVFSQSQLIEVKDRPVSFSLSASPATADTAVTISLSNGRLSAVTNDTSCENDPENPNYPTHTHWWSSVGTQTNPSNTATILTGPFANQTIPLTVNPGQAGTDCVSGSIGTQSTFSGSRQFVIPSTLSNGSYSMNVRVTDNLGAFLTKQVSFTVSRTTPAPTVDLKAGNSNGPVNIISGNHVNLNWTTTNSPTSCTATSGSGWSGSQAFGPTNTLRINNLTQSSTYTITCTNAGGSASDSVVVNVVPVLTCSPASQTVDVGENASFTGAGGSGTWSWTTSTDGSPVTGGNYSTFSTKYSATGNKTVTVKRGSQEVECGVTVESGALFPDPPTVTLTAKPAGVNSGGESILSWTVSGDADSCTASASPSTSQWNGAKSFANNTYKQTITNITQNTTYSISCSNEGGSNSSNATVTVTAPVTNPTVDITVRKAGPVSPLIDGPLYLKVGEKPYVYWKTENEPTACEAFGSWFGGKNTVTGDGVPDSVPSSGLAAGTYRYGISCSKPNAPGASDFVDVIVEADTKTLTVTKTGTGAGTVTSDDGGINCGADCTQSYTTSPDVTLYPSPANGSTFAGWSGACTGTGNCIVSMTQSRNVTATFNKNAPVDPPTVDITVRKAGTSDSYIDGPLYLKVGEKPFVRWTTTNEPTACEAFGDWSGGRNAAGNTTGGVPNSVPSEGLAAGTYQYGISCSKTNASQVASDSVLVIVEAGTKTLSVSKTGTGAGTVTSSPAGISCGADCVESYTTSPNVTLTAAAAEGSIFAGWSDACTNATGNCVVSMTQSRNVIATFNRNPNQTPIGYHDANNSNTCRVRGWAADPDNLTQNIQVAILSDGAEITQATAGTYRADLDTAGVCADGTCSFNVDIRNLISSNEAHSIRVQAIDGQTGTMHDLNWTPKTINCSPTTGIIEVRSNVPTTWTITGEQSFTQSTASTSVDYIAPIGGYTIAPATLPGYTGPVVEPATKSHAIGSGGDTRRFTLTYTPIDGGSVDIRANGSNSPDAIPTGTQASLSWTTNGITSGSCTASSNPTGWSNSKPNSMSYPPGENSPILQSQTTFTLTCRNSTGVNISDSVTVPTRAPRCSDGEDNDGDTLEDYPADPGCYGESDDDEANAPEDDGDDDDETPITACNDGFDNDGDGDIDLVDSGCSGPEDTTEQPSPDIREI